MSIVLNQLMLCLATWRDTRAILATEAQQICEGEQSVMLLLFVNVGPHSDGVLVCLLLAKQTTQNLKRDISWCHRWFRSKKGHIINSFLIKYVGIAIHL